MHPTTDRRHRRLPLLVALTLLVVPIAVILGGSTSAEAAATTPTTYQDYVYASGTSSDGPSADKPQSKLWYAAGNWWALMVPDSGSGVHINRLDRSTHSWVDSGTVVDGRTNSTGDALWDGSKLYVISRTASGDINVIRLSLSANHWSIDSGFPVTVGTGGTETATMDKDSTGTLWATWTKSNKVMVTHSTSSQSAFTTAVPLPVPDPTVHGDDISAVIAYRGKVGIMWSDHTTGSSEATTTSYMRFAQHVDGTGDSSSDWTVQNVQTGVYSSDDHINLKSWSSDPSGRVYAAFKTSNEDDPNSSSSAPQIIVAARSASGSVSLTTVSTVAEKETRPQLVIDSSTGTLHVLMTTPETGGTIYDKTSPLANLSFGSGKGTPFITWSGAKINNVSVSKDPVTSTTGIVALATDHYTDTYYHAELGGDAGGPTDTTPPSKPANFAGSSAGSTVSLSWSASTDDVGVADYVLSRDGSKIATVTGTSYSDTSVADGSHTYSVVAEDAAGNTSPAATTTVTVSTSPGGGNAPTLREVDRVAATASATVELSRPADAQPGDVLLAAISSRGNPKITAPAGWSPVRTDDVPNVVGQSVFSRVASNADPTSWSFGLGKSQSAAVGQIADYAGASGVAGSDGNTGTSGEVLTAPTVAASGAATSVVFFSDARSTTLTAQPPLIDRGQQVASGSSTLTSSSADATGTTGPYEAKAAASSNWIAQTVVLIG